MGYERDKLSKMMMIIGSVFTIRLCCRGGFIGSSSSQNQPSISHKLGSREKEGSRQIIPVSPPRNGQGETRALSWQTHLNNDSILAQRESKLSPLDYI